MALGTHRHLGREAIERARRRMPELVPDSVEVVELARGEPYVVVRLRSSGVLVLDRLGRLVRNRDRLSAIARHLRAVEQVGRAFEEARLPQRLEHVRLSLALIDRPSARRPQRTPSLDGVSSALRGLELAIEAALAQVGRWREAPPTERTLRRSVSLLNEAAAADRAVIRTLRDLGAALSPELSDPLIEKLRRWVVARLSSPDIPLFMQELAAADQDLYAASFWKATRV